MSDEKQAGLDLPARFIPTPRSISAEAQAFLSNGFNIDPPKIPVTDKEAWKRYIAGVEAYMTPVAAARAEPNLASIEEHALPNATLYELTPKDLAPEREGKVLYHIHGGAFIVGSGKLSAYTAEPVATAAKMRSYSVDYRMPPEHPFPAGLDDCVEGYEFLLARYRPEDIMLEGGSAGACLVAATILAARDKGLPLPKACVLHTAGVDLTRSGDTFQTNEILDVVLRKTDDETLSLYYGDHDPADPLVSPLFADFTKGFPPSLLISGTRDILLSPTVMMHRVLRRAGLEAELHVFEAMPHGGFGHATPEDRERLEETARFIVRQFA